SLSAVVWARIPRGTCSPTWSGLGFDKHLTLILLRVGHQATWGGSYSRNGQTSSSLTGRTSGLLFESVPRKWDSRPLPEFIVILKEINAINGRQRGFKIMGGAGPASANTIRNKHIAVATSTFTTQISWSKPHFSFAVLRLSSSKKFSRNVTWVSGFSMPLSEA